MKKQYDQGFFIPRNPKKYKGNINQIIYRSSYERKFFTWCDMTPEILSWQSEETIIPYVSPLDGKMHRYFLDAVVWIKQNDASVKKYWIEIKPLSQTQPPKKRSRKTKKYIYEVNQWLINKAKWTAATAAANKNGAKFMIITERTLGTLN